MLDGNGAGNGDNGTGAGGTPGQQTTSSGGETPTWEQVLAGLPEPQRKLYEAHTAGLKKALDAERQAAKDASAELRRVRDQLKEGPGKEALDAMIGERDAAMQRADFIAEAVRPEIGCNDPALAYLAAVSGSLIDGKGRVNWDGLKAAHPNLFGQPKPAAPAGNAGAGTGGQGPAKPSMNTFIRRSAGRE